MPGQRIIALFIDIPDIYREQILLHEVGIMLQVYRNNDISPSALVNETGTGLTTAPSTSQ